MSIDFWKDSCSLAFSVPLHTLIATTNALSAVVVSSTSLNALTMCDFTTSYFAMPTAPHPLPKIVSFAACAAASAYMCFRWFRLSLEDRNRVWKDYGWFTALLCLGCSMGVVSCAAWSRFIIYYYHSFLPGNTVAPSDYSQIAASAAQVSGCCPHPWPTLPRAPALSMCFCNIMPPPAVHAMGYRIPAYISRQLRLPRRGKASRARSLDGVQQPRGDGHESPLRALWSSGGRVYLRWKFDWNVWECGSVSLHD